MSECKTCEGSGRIPVGDFGSYHCDGEAYDAPSYEVCDDCGGSGSTLNYDSVQAIMWLVFEYARLADGIDAAEGEARDLQRMKMHEKDGEVREAIATAQTGAYAEGRADQFADDKARIDELLGALKTMVHTWEAYLSSPTCYPAFNRAKYVIAKATGEQS